MTLRGSARNASIFSIDAIPVRYRSRSRSLRMLPATAERHERTTRDSEMIAQPRLLPMSATAVSLQRAHSHIGKDARFVGNSVTR